ncbi:hypothetical protein [Marinobacterium jannaschii]|uniref:hypothetical protein n=1 Tax=Marinobacterium jannaschii TaxID=64970 RepID=UPI000481C942|nr:hypothetical protein [Marinobacterium jannaschii]
MSSARIIAIVLTLWLLAVPELYAQDFFTDRNELGYDPNGDAFPTQGWDNFADPNEEELAKAVPHAQNDTASIDRWRIFISGWQVDPPNWIIVHVIDDRPYLISESYIDIRVVIGKADDAENMLPRTRTIVRGIPVKPGFNRIPIAIHNEIDQIVHANIIAVANKAAIKLFD